MKSTLRYTVKNVHLCCLLSLCHSLSRAHTYTHTHSDSRACMHTYLNLILLYFLFNFLLLIICALLHCWPWKASPTFVILPFFIIIIIFFMKLILIKCGLWNCYRFRCPWELPRFSFSSFRFRNFAWFFRARRYR